VVFLLQVIPRGYKEMAVRTANFLSGFLQVVDPKEIFPGEHP
jgi:hypothetical protein